MRSLNTVVFLVFFYIFIILQKFTQPSVIEQLAYALIVCGAVMFILSFLGYCGAIRESQCLLTVVSQSNIVFISMWEKMMQALVAQLAWDV